MQSEGKILGVQNKNTKLTLQVERINDTMSELKKLKTL